MNLIYSFSDSIKKSIQSLLNPTRIKYHQSDLGNEHRNIKFVSIQRTNHEIKSI